MYRSRLAVLLVPFAAALVLSASSVVRKDPVGVYAVLDSVVFHPSEAKAERVQLWGIFALPDAIGLKDGEIDYISVAGRLPPERGYLHYTVNPKDEARSREEWAKLKGFAGTGQPVAFGRYWPEADPQYTMATLETSAGAQAFHDWVNYHNGRVHPAGKPLAAPDTFRFGTGFSMHADRTRPVVAALFADDIPPAER